MCSVAESMTQDRQFDELVLRAVAAAGNQADHQALAWLARCSALPYRRENGETYRDWRPCLGVATPDNPQGIVCGGDCDDLTIILLAGLKTLGLTALPEVLADENGDGFHVRVRVGLPAYDPTVWAVMDPVWESERQWAMVDTPLLKSPLLVSGAPPPPAFVPVVLPSGDGLPSWMPSWWMMAVVGAAAFYAGRRFYRANKPST